MMIGSAQTLWGKVLFLVRTNHIFLTKQQIVFFQLRKKGFFLLKLISYYYCSNFETVKKKQKYLNTIIALNFLVDARH